MSKSRKDLRLLSIIVLICVAINFVMTMIDICQFGLALPSVVIEGVSKEVIEILAITIIVFKLLFLFPQVYVGIKGMKIADGATCNKAPRVWALVLAILAGIALISSAIDLFKAFDVDQLLTVLDGAIDVVLFTCTYLCLRKIAKA